MLFINDLVDGRYAWARPAPLGLVEDGWAAIASDLLRAIDRAVAPHSGTSVDILNVAERDGTLCFDYVVDGAGREDPALLAALASAAAHAATRSSATCARCGRPGRVRHHRPAWPSTRCDDHATGIGVTSAPLVE